MGFLVRMMRVTDPKGERFTCPVVPIDYKSGQVSFPSNMSIDQLISEIEEKYETLVRTVQVDGVRILPEAVNTFLEHVSQDAIVGGLLEVLMEDLQLDSKIIWKSLTKVSWTQQLMKYMKEEFRKAKKDDPIKYAEAACQLVELFGSGMARALLRAHGASMGESTLSALCRVAVETPKIKDLIRQGKLKLTVAFELKGASEERERLAEEIASKSFKDATKYLRKLAKL